jgi:hypothetical protein
MVKKECLVSLKKENKYNIVYGKMENLMAEHIYSRMCTLNSSLKKCYFHNNQTPACRWHTLQTIPGVSTHLKEETQMNLTKQELHIILSLLYNLDEPTKEQLELTKKIVELI